MVRCWTGSATGAEAGTGTMSPAEVSVGLNGKGAGTFGASARGSVADAPDAGEPLPWDGWPASRDAGCPRDGSCRGALRDRPAGAVRLSGVAVASGCGLG